MQRGTSNIVFPIYGIFPLRAAADGWALGCMWLVEGFCVGAIRQSARLFGASGRNSGRTPTPLDLQSAYTFLNCSFPYRPTLIRGVLSGVAQHRHGENVAPIGDRFAGGESRQA